MTAALPSTNATASSRIEAASPHVMNTYGRVPIALSHGQGCRVWDVNGKSYLDALGGIAVNTLGHNHPKLVPALQDQIAKIIHSCNYYHVPNQEVLAKKLVELSGMTNVFFCNSGSESIDTALKIALAYWNIQGQGQKTRLIGRERGYHGVGFGGISVGGIVANRKFFGTLLAGVDHLPHTYNRAEQAFTKGEPEWGAHLADDLERIVALHDASTIAAVVVEPMAGSTGVLPPPKGYLKRLREICTKYGILLIFDEVITGFGRLGTPFAAERYGVIPDMITFAKGVNSGTVPMGGVIARKGIYDAFMKGPEHVIELFHGYTYSAHPLACAAALATLDVYRDEKLFERTKEIEPRWMDAVMTLKDLPNVLDIRTIGLVAAIDLASIPDAFGKRAFNAMDKAFQEHGMMIRSTGDTLAVTPPLIISDAQIDELVDKLRKTILSVA